MIIQGVIPTSNEDTASASLIPDDNVAVAFADKLANETIPSDRRTEKSSVNEKLRRTIQTRRRNSGLAEIKVEWKNPEPEVLSEKEQLRLKRRRESNRRAAAKSRIKKREENEKKKQMMEELITENQMLKKRLEQQEEFIRHHMATCPNGASFADGLFDVR